MEQVGCESKPHVFRTEEDGVDRCAFCSCTFREAVRGFGSNVAPTKNKPRSLDSLSGK